MGKKHKKHKTKGYDDEYTEEGEKGPLKLVLKVGGSDAASDMSFSQSPYDEKRHKHKKKKKKKSGDKDKDRSRYAENDGVRPEAREIQDEEEDMSQSQEEEEEEDVYEPAIKKRRHLDFDEESNSSQDVQPLRSVEGKDDERGILKESLLYIHKNLQRKDVNGFFAYPVNDVIAPGYSTIIKEPMDFSTMLANIENDQYDSILDYKKDFVTMCNNAMTYNRPETIYYKDAKRLLQHGMKTLSKEKLLSMKRSLGFMCSITMDELGMNKLDNTAAVVDAINAKEKEYEKTVKNRDKIGRFEAFPDNMTSEEILAQAKAAAKEAAEMLTLREPRARLSFLRRRDDGTTSLTVLNSDNDGIVGENEKIISLGELTGKLTSGTGSIAGFKEDKRNKVTHVNYLDYGPFSSHAPMYDTSFSNISKEESDLLLSTYGDETGVQYAKSVMKFVEDAEEDCTKIVDSLLDVLTKGQHTIAMKQVEQKRKEDQEKLAEIKKKMMAVSGSTVTTTDQLNQVTGGVETKDSIQKRLEKTADLLLELQQTQTERLSLKPPPHLGNLPGPNEQERQIADSVTSELTKLVQETTPHSVVSLQGVRRAMGISLEEVEGAEENQPIEIEDQQQDNQSNYMIQNASADQSDSGLQNNMDSDQMINNEMLMAADDTLIDNL